MGKLNILLHIKRDYEIIGLYEHNKEGMIFNIKNKMIRKFQWNWIVKNTYNYSPKLNNKRTLKYSYFVKNMGKRCLIKSGTIIEYPDNITIGDGVSIQYNCFISGYGGVIIGNDVSLGNNTKIISSAHPYNRIPYKYNILKKSPVSIGNNVITGADVIILGGVNIGDNVMIGAGSVVTKNIPEGSVYAGNPAHLIKFIDNVEENGL